MKKILVSGSYNVDLMSRTPHMPSPGETVLGGPFKMGPGGKGANQAVAAARLGYDVMMLTKLGEDMFGDQALANFEKENIDTTHVGRDADESTGTALIAVDEQKENIIVVAPGANAKITKNDILQAKSSFKDADIILTQLETSLEAFEATVELAADLDKPIVLNPAPYIEIDKKLLEKIDYITPNETEASSLTGIEVVDEASARQASVKLIESGVKAVIITLGKAGCFLYDGTGEGELIPSFKVEAVDTTGAGDAFNGAFTSFIADGYELRDAVIRASAVAALAVTKVGTAPAMPYNQDLEEFLEK